MTERSSRKAAIAAFKGREPHRGVFAVRCAATGTTWVGSWPNLDAARNGLWFALRVGSHRDQSLQSEWQAHGEAAFRYDVLEELEPDVLAMDVPGLLKQKRREWAAREGARTLLP